MTGTIRKAMLLAVLGIMAASVALAGIPSAANCTVPTFIKVVGTAAGIPDSRGTFSITVRDAGNTVVPNCNVQLDFTACTDMSLCNTGADVNCAAKVVSGLTNVSGVVTFTVVGAGLHPGGVFAGPGLGCVSIYAGGGYLIGNATSIVYDLNGAIVGTGKNGVTIGDLSAFLADLGGGVYRGRSDYNQSATVSIADLVPWLQCLGAGTSSSGCTTAYCP